MMSSAINRHHIRTSQPDCSRCFASASSCRVLAPFRVFHRELLAPRPPAVNIKSALLWRLGGCERPRPCRAERSPSPTRAPLLSPESQMRVSAVLGHSSSPIGEQEGPWRRACAHAPPAPICSACRAGLPSARSTVDSPAAKQSAKVASLFPHPNAARAASRTKQRLQGT